MIMVVMGIYIFVLPDSIRISPGSLPNQFSVPGAKCNNNPRVIKIIPAKMNHRAMSVCILFYLRDPVVRGPGNRKQLSCKFIKNVRQFIKALVIALPLQCVQLYRRCRLSWRYKPATNSFPACAFDSE
jgi:hypothetical protein